MKLSVLSDLHLEFSDMEHPEVDADVCIVAGDLHTGLNGVKWLKKCKNPIYVLGNHEFYGHRIATLRKEYNKVKKIKYLENDYIEIEDIKIFGCTLWTDFKLFGDSFFAIKNAKRFMNDYQFIKDIKSQHFHRESVDRLKKFLKLPGKKVIVTHHAPSIQSIHTKWRMNALTPAFASNLEVIIRDYQPNLWIHGHTHDSCDYKINNTRIICNPRGYPPYNPYFNPNLIVEI